MTTSDTTIGLKVRAETVTRPLGGFAATLVIALVFLYGLPLLPNLNIGLTYGELVERAPFELGAALQWALGDWGDAQFYKSYIGGLFLILGAFVALGLEKSKSKYNRFGISYGSGLFTSVLAAQVIAASISNLLYTRLLVNDPVAAAIGWVPTFIPICSLAPGLVLIFGGGWKKVLTAGIFGGLVGAPGSFFIIKYIAVPTGMPVAVGNVGVMVIAAILFHETFKYVPWMKKEEPPAMPHDRVESNPEPIEVKSENENILFVRRVFADLTEANFYGSDIASYIMVVGLIIHFIMNPMNPSYGSGWLGAILASQLVASGIGLYLYWPRFKELGWIATFVPVVTLGPAAVLMYGPHLYVILVAGIFGGFFGAPIAGLISSKLPSHMHGYIGAVSSMLILTLVFIAVMQVMPWFGQPGLW
jgi:hypothetical protein